MATEAYPVSEELTKKVENDHNGDIENYFAARGLIFPSNVKLELMPTSNKVIIMCNEKNQRKVQAIIQMLDNKRILIKPAQ